MRRELVHMWTKELTYEIRWIVETAKVVESYWIPITWENIGDPVNKWEKIPLWMKKIVQEACKIDSSYAYSPTKWLETTREYIAKQTPIISKEDIIFFNWLWDAISIIYKNLSFDARIIGPNPAYTTHSSAEAAHAWSEHITYPLDPNNWWNPDLVELENKVKYNPNIVWILVISPDNPTGAVFKKDVLLKIVDIARRYKLFVIFDEIYEKLVYNEKDRILLSEIIWEVPWISMKWMSKDVPWPGSRCWRIEVYNQDKDPTFAQYIKAIYNAKMLEVCSTTLPQSVLPSIYTHPSYKKYQKQRIDKYRKRAQIAYDVFKNLDLVSIVKPKGAFYLSITLNVDKFPPNANLEIENPNLKEFIEWKLLNARFDKKFCYYVLAKTGICIVPLSSFNSSYDGFRMTLLEENIKKFESTLQTLKSAIIEYAKK